MADGYGGGRRGDALGCKRRHAVARKTIGRGDDVSRRKSMMGGLDLDGTERRMDRVSGSVDYVEGLERPVEIADLSMATCTRRGRDGLKAGLRFECAE